MQDICVKTKFEDGIDVDTGCPYTLREACKGGCRVDAFPFTGKLDSMDTTARSENLPIKYRKSEKVFECDDFDIFALNPLRCVEEEFGYRISYKQAYAFVTKELKDFLDKNSTFTRTDIMNDFSVDSATASNIISRLIKNGIIYLARR